MENAKFNYISTLPGPDLLAAVQYITRFDNPPIPSNVAINHSNCKILLHIL
jgi:hypothetical protein